MTACNRIVYRLNHILNHIIPTTSPTELVFLIKSRKAAGLSFFSLCLYKFKNFNNTTFKKMTGLMDSLMSMLTVTLSK